MLIIPAIVPATLAAYSVVGEREQGTLEPVLTTPIRSEEFLLGKALAALVPTLVISYAMFGIFLAVVACSLSPPSRTPSFRLGTCSIQLLFTPLLAGWSIWWGWRSRRARATCASPSSWARLPACRRWR